GPSTDDAQWSSANSSACESTPAVWRDSANTPPARCRPPPSRCPTCGRPSRITANGILQRVQFAQRRLSNARRHLKLEVRRDRSAFCDIAGNLGMNRGGWDTTISQEYLRRSSSSLVE